MPGWALKGVVGALALATLFAFVFWIVSLRSERDGLKMWQQTVVTATADASGNSKVTKDTAVQQINFMGATLRSYADSFDKQNTAIKALETRSSEAAMARDSEVAKRAQAVARAEELSARLKAKALTPSERVDLEEQLREAQDAARDAGL